MSQPQTPEQVLDTQGDCTPGRRDEDSGEGTQCSHRMLSFSDALLSIIATVMILPVTHTEISPEQHFDKSIQKLLATRIAVYLMTFLIVTVAWAAHTRLFQVVGKIDDTLALLNLACMMTITLLPYTFSLMVTFPDVPLGIFLFCVCVIAIGTVQPALLQALIVGYAFHFPHLLSPQIQCSAHRALYRQHVLHIVLRGPVLCFAAAIFSLFFFPLSYLLMATIIFLPYVSKATSWCRDRLVGHQEPPAHPLEFTFDLHEPLSKERVEAFSDGVYAIVATLLILDICEDNVPDPKDVREKFRGSLVAALGVYGPRFLAYFGSFATVGLLWFAHHSLFLHVRRATRAMGLLNTLSLAFVGGLPLAYQQTSAFAQQPHDELERVRVSCAIIFFASIFQLAIWTAALLHEAETLQPSVWFGGQEHAFMFAKLALYPCASLLAFASTCFLSGLSTAIFHLMQIAVPSTFLLLRLLVRVGQAGLRGLRGLAGPAHSWPGTTGEADPQSLLLPAP
ncbi:endosomal/lysosomal potassium channel TMEM175 isoform X1 [Lemur catta]|uniref:endosomal/lysosomal potassium channel TMEM175 isoform X1 n=2 Tax=Lemur catta TaxID=9447 RepID=UPI001E26B819|nr:endosomal/lysosomal potassium channel TMEM175 isoform X1 [Lemur catta]